MVCLAPAETELRAEQWLAPSPVDNALSTTEEGKALLARHEKERADKKAEKRALSKSAEQTAPKKKRKVSDEDAAPTTSNSFAATDISPGTPAPVERCDLVQ